MHIWSKTLLLALLVSTAPAYAQGYAKDNSMVPTKHLQPTQFYHDRPRVGIYDTGAIVSDYRRRDVAEPLFVPIPALPGGRATAAIPQNAIPMGGNVYGVPVAGAPSGIGASNPMLGDRSYLQDGGFSSYVPKQPITAGRNLPNGTNVGVHGRMIQAPSMVSKAPATLTRPSKSGFVKEWEPTEAALYSGPNTSVGGATKTTTKSQVRGVLLMDKLLQKQK